MWDRNRLRTGGVHLSAHWHWRLHPRPMSIAAVASVRPLAIFLRPWRSDLELPPLRDLCLLQHVIKAADHLIRLQGAVVGDDVPPMPLASRRRRQGRVLVDAEVGQPLFRVLAAGAEVGDIAVPLGSAPRRGGLCLYRSLGVAGAARADWLDCRSTRDRWATHLPGWTAVEDASSRSLGALSDLRVSHIFRAVD